MDVRASRGVVKDEQSAKDTASKAESREHYLEVYLDMFLADPIISTAIDTTVDMVTRNGFKLILRDGETAADSTIKKANKMLKDELDLDTVLDNLIYQLLIYGSTYLEKRRTEGGRINELWALEATEMAIKHDIHGKILGYVQKSGKNDIEFSPEEVVYIPLRQIGTRVEGYEPLEPVARTFSTNVFAHNYLRDVFLNLPPKYLYVLQGSGPEQRKKLIEQIKLAKRDPTIDIVTQILRDSKLEVQTLQPSFDDSLLKILEYAREQILLVTRVPPVWVGLVNNDGANRGNSEAQIFSFETKIKKIQQKIESAFDRQLLPELGLDKFRFKFNSVSLKEEKQIIENARQFRDMGLDEDTIIDYLKNNGVGLRDDAKFEEVDTPKSKDLMPSRRRANRMTDDINSELDRTGVSEQAAQKAQQNNEG